MCEFCGCGMIRLAEQVQQRQPKGKALGVHVNTAPAEPKSSSRVTTDSREKPRPVREELTAEHV